MKNRFYLWLAACLVLLLGISPSVPAKSDDTSRVGFTEADAEYYMPDSVYGFFRPGVDFHLVSFEIPDDLQPVVTFDLTDPAGAPLDIEGVLTPGPITMYFMIDHIPQGEEVVVSYCQTSAFCYDRGGELTTLSMGSYTYKFATVLPEDYDVDATHTLSSVARRQFTDPEFDFAGLEPEYHDNDVYNFIPSGEGTPETRDIVKTETCNNCHNPLGMHGGQRFKEVRICLHCHNEENVGEYAFAPLIHRVHSNNEPELIEEGHVVHFPADLNDCQVCHTGGTPTAARPLVASPNPTPVCDGSGLGMTTIEWGDAGAVEIRINAADGKLFGKANSAGSAETGKWVSNGKAFYLVDAADGSTIQKTNVNTTVYGCAGNAPYSYGNPEGTVGAMHSNWMTNPGRAACGGCHINIDWETGENHVGGPQPDDEFCSFCHQADSGNEFDRSVKGAHTVQETSTQLDGVYVNIKSITNTGPGQSPVVTFAVFGKSGPIDPNTMNRLRFVLVGPNDDFDFYLQESANGNSVASGTNWTYTFSGKLPMDAKGSYSFGFEGRNVVTLQTPAGPIENVRDLAENYLVPFAVTDASAVARDMIVDDAKCEACHSNLALHGGNRHNGGQYCQTCHAPNALGPTEVTETEEDSIHFKFMVHKIHRGADLENGYVMEGTDFSEVHFPGDLRDCDTCHVDADPSPRVYRSSSWIPLPEGRLPTQTPISYLTEMPPITAACLSCHDGDAAASHALANSSEVGESCATCHGEGKTYSVERVHAR